MSYKQLKKELLSTPEGSVESFKIKLAFALTDFLKRNKASHLLSDRHLASRLGLGLTEIDQLLQGELDLTLSQVLRITKVIGVKVDIRLEGIE